jgi:hypothetical protein
VSFVRGRKNNDTMILPQDIVGVKYVSPFYKREEERKLPGSDNFLSSSHLLHKYSPLNSAKNINEVEIM